METYDERKGQIKALKDKLIDHFKSGNGNDSTLSGLLKEFKLGLEELDLLEYCLSDLVEKGLINKSASLDHNEFDQGNNLKLN